MCGVASFGGRAAYIGKVSDDELGDVFGHDLNAVGVAFRPGAPRSETPTGRCIIVVTPDAQRTMNTYLGVAELLSSDDLDEATIADGARALHGGLPVRPRRRQEGVPSGRRRGPRRRAHGVADAVRLVLRRPPPRRLPPPSSRDEVDILFGNDDELCSLYEVDDARRGDRPRCAGSAQLAAITVRRRRLATSSRPTMSSTSRPSPCRVLDTTGAGDLYAAGFLYGFTRGAAAQPSAAALGSIAAAEVISHVGPRPLSSCAPCCRDRG